ncbi:hypothetical protein MG293_000782 [Ovis ammon polii]|uniref:Uncharacterized protein n=1 Tax=Ovis ammon polii TaxID=230172 RepID=A0AAD4UPA4_OVIAM|nr:hypothetical protein MG293_000782 [Ovis ammon polii]
MLKKQLLLLDHGKVYKKSNYCGTEGEKNERDSEFYNTGNQSLFLQIVSFYHLISSAFGLRLEFYHQFSWGSSLQTAYIGRLTMKLEHPRVLVSMAKFHNFCCTLPITLLHYEYIVVFDDYNFWYEIASNLCGKSHFQMVKSEVNELISSVFSNLGFPDDPVLKNPHADTGDASGVGNDNPL